MFFNAPSADEPKYSVGKVLFYEYVRALKRELQQGLLDHAQE